MTKLGLPSTQLQLRVQLVPARDNFLSDSDHNMKHRNASSSLSLPLELCRRLNEAVRERSTAQYEL